MVQLAAEKDLLIRAQNAAIQKKVDDEGDVWVDTGSEDSTDGSSASSMPDPPPGAMDRALHYGLRDPAQTPTPPPPEGEPKEDWGEAWETPYYYRRNKRLSEPDAKRRRQTRRALRAASLRGWEMQVDEDVVDGEHNWGIPRGWGNKGGVADEEDEEVDLDAWKGEECERVMNLDDPNIERMPRGMLNIGNTCYLSSVMQALRAIPELIEGLLTTPWLAPPAPGREAKSAAAAAASGIYAAAARNLAAAARLTLRQLGQPPPSGYEQMMAASRRSRAAVERGDWVMCGFDDAEERTAALEAGDPLPDPADDRAVRPHTLVHHLRVAVPQFAAITPMGMPQQQDAEEALSAILLALSTAMKPPDGNSSIVEDLFQVELETTITCIENPKEPPTVERTKTWRLPVIIDGKTNIIHEGFTKAFQGQLEKDSPSLGRSAVYNTTTRITRLPPYLIVHFVRFFWRNDTGDKAKICRTVYFPVVMDMDKHLTPSLGRRLAVALARKREAALKRQPLSKALDEGVGGIDETTASAWAAEERAAVDNERRLEAAIRREGETVDSEELEDRRKMRREEEELKTLEEREAVESRLAALSLTPVNRTDNQTNDSTATAPDVPTGDDYVKPARRSMGKLAGASAMDPTNLYELVSIVTHSGADADAGHYMGWTRTAMKRRVKSGTIPDTLWLKFDDSRVSLVKEEQVKETSGGSEGPVAYVCIYGRSEAVAEGIRADASADIY